MMMKLFLTFIASIILQPQKALADYQIHETTYSVRALGMGNAYSAIADGTDALFYNPAALGRTKTINWRVGSFDAGVNGMNVYESVQSMSGFNSIEDYSELYGDYIWIGGGGRTALSFPGFGAAYYTNVYLDLELKSPSMPELDGGYINDQGLIIGGAFEMWKNAYFGISAKRIYRQGGVKTVGLGTIAGGDFSAVQDEFNAKGTGYGIDMGVLIEMEGALRPTFSLAWKDVGYTKFIFENASDPAPPAQRDDLTAGFGITTELPLMTIKTAVDIKHLLDSSHQFGKKLHLGTEVDLPLFDLRAGFNQGYYTLGAGMDLLFFRFDAVSYGVERGVYPGQLEDRRYQIEMSMEFAIDADFNFTSLSSGSSSRLKQRR